MYEINKSKPAKPARLTPATRVRTKYPFDGMDVGDSFFVPERTRNTLSTHCSTVGKKLGKTFSSRMCYMRKTKTAGWKVCFDGHPDAVLGIGVWRDA